MMTRTDTINWVAIDRCWEDFAQTVVRTKSPLHVFTYQIYMLKEWGIDHNSHYVKIVDKKKYMMFLLRFG